MWHFLHRPYDSFSPVYFNQFEEQLTQKDSIQDVYANENWHMFSHASVIAVPKMTKAVDW